MMAFARAEMYGLNKFIRIRTYYDSHYGTNNYQIGRISLCMSGKPRVQVGLLGFAQADAGVDAVESLG
jgi:hypothetical protein